MSRDRFEATIRRAKPGDGAWPLRWVVTVYDDDDFRRPGPSFRSEAFSRRGAHYIARRYIAKVLRSEGSVVRFSANAADAKRGPE